MNDVCKTKNILICPSCFGLILIHKIFVIFQQIYVSFTCSCGKHLKVILLEKFIQYFSYFPEEKFMKFALFKTERQDESQKIFHNDFLCGYSQESTKYCVDCHIGICNLCYNLHKFHRLFNYQEKVFLNKKSFHKFEKLGYNSYFSLKQISSCIKILSEISKVNVSEIEKYIKFNEDMNDTLFILFKLLLNTYKYLPCYVNYINLTHYCKFNQQIKFEKSKKNLSQKIINYLQSYFIIPLHSNIKFFSFQNEVKLGIIKKGKDYSFLKMYNKENDNENYKEKMYCVNDDILAAYYRGDVRGKMTVRGRIAFKKGGGKKYLNLSDKEYKKLKKSYIKYTIKNLKFLNNQKICVAYLGYLGFLIYNIDFEKNTVFLESIYHPLVDDVFIINDNYMLAIDTEGNSTLLKYENCKFEDIEVFEIEINYCVKMNETDFLFLTKNEIIKYTFIDNKLLKGDYINKDYDNYTFGESLSNGYAILNKEDTIEFVNINIQNENTISFKNDIFMKLCVVNENINKQIIYCQTVSYVIIINIKIYQIQSIYQTFQFKFYPLNPCTNTNALMKYFEQMNFSNKKISIAFDMNGWKDIIQLSYDKILIISANGLFYYQII